jgi:hypothetical protein
MIKLKDILNEDSKAGWGSDPNKPKKVQAIETKVNKLLDSWKGGKSSVRNIESSPRLNRLRKAWDEAVSTSGWKPKYYFGDLLA